jgi:5'-nucleotidase
MNTRQFVLLPALLIVSACGQGGSTIEPATEAAPTVREGQPRILVSNDDGYSTEGIAALAEELAAFADVLVVTPLENQSGASQSTSALLNRSGFRVHKVIVGAGLTGYAVEGSPADNVYFGIDIFGKTEPFDLVVSGINHGPNHGNSYFYSGTVGAAFQALSLGIPAIAVSQANSREEFQTAAEFTAKVVRRVLASALAPGVALSINVPAGKIKGAVAAPPGGAAYDVELQLIENDEKISVYKAKFTPASEPKPGHDVRAYMDGFITVTPLQLDRTHRASLMQLEEWEFVTAAKQY